jgi:hypothetical protein
MKKIGGWLAILTGSVMFLIGLFILFGTLSFLSGTVTAQGTIIRCVWAGKSGYRPVVNFQTQTGQSITFSSPSPDSCHQGDTVTVRYHADDPQYALIDSFFGTWWPPLLFIGLGLMGFFGGMAQIERL